MCNFLERKKRQTVKFEKTACWPGPLWGEKVQKSQDGLRVKVKLTFCTAAPPQTRVTLLLAAGRRRLLQLLTLCLAATHPHISLRDSRPMRIVSLGDGRAPPEEVLFLCPLPPPSPLSTSVRGGGGRSAVGDQQASAGRSRGRRLSELCSLSPSWQAHSAPVRAAGSCGRLPAGGRTAGEDNSPVTPCRRRRMLQHPHPS